MMWRFRWWVADILERAASRLRFRQWPHKFHILPVGSSQPPANRPSADGGGPAKSPEPYTKERSDD